MRPLLHLLCIAIALAGFGAPALAQTQLGPLVMSSGGRAASSASMQVKVTLGQAITGKTSGAGVFSGLGFWERIGFDSATALPDGATPLATRLLQNAPNPFNPTTTIRFSLAEPERARIEVFDLRGRRMARLLDEALPAGEHALTFRADGLASGIYLLQLSAGRHRESRRMVLLK